MFTVAKNNGVFPSVWLFGIKDFKIILLSGSWSQAKNIV